MNWKKGIAVALSAIAVMAMVAGCGSNTATNDQKKNWCYSISRTSIS